MQPIDKGCSINDSLLTPGDDHKRRLVRVAIPQVEGFYQPTVHYDCVHNQVQSVRNRVIGVVPKPTAEGLASVRIAARRFAATLHPTGVDDIYALANRNVGQKAKRYRDAALKVSHFGVNDTDACIKMFVKAERFNPSAKVNPEPRAVQFRGAKYCVALAMHLRPIEEQIYRSTAASDGVPPSRNVAKGLNAVERAELLVEKATHFTNPRFITLDASKFDKHVSTGLLEIEHHVYLTCNNDPTFVWLLQQQLMNRCFTNSGLRYKCKGRRMSGDMNTAIGNVVIMLMMMVAYCSRILKLKRWDCLDDGDDIIVILEEEDVSRFQKEVPTTFGTFGMSMKVSAAVESIHDVEFCQSKIIEYKPSRYKFVRDYRAVLSKSTSGVRNWSDPIFRTRAIHAIGTCELVLGLGVPVLQSYALALLRNSSGSKDIIRHAPDGLRLRALRDARLLGLKDISLVKPQVIEQCARASFARAFGLQEADQVALERRFDNWSFDILNTQTYGNELEVYSWTLSQSTGELYHG